MWGGGGGGDFSGTGTRQSRGYLGKLGLYFSGSLRLNPPKPYTPERQVEEAAIESISHIIFNSSARRGFSDFYVVEPGRHALRLRFRV